MRINLAKFTWLVAIVAAILLLVASPVIVVASMEKPEENCDSNPCQDEAAIPLCCLMPDCPLSHCILTNAVTKEVLLPGRFTPNEDIYLAWSPKSMATETSPNPARPLQRVAAQELSSCLYTVSHCRDCLNSEEPPLV